MESATDKVNAALPAGSAKESAQAPAADETATTGASSAQLPDEQQKQSGRAATDEQQSGAAEGATTETAVAPAEPMGTSARTS